MPGLGRITAIGALCAFLAGIPLGGAPLAAAQAPGGAADIPPVPGGVPEKTFEIVAGRDVCGIEAATLVGLWEDYLKKIAVTGNGWTVNFNSFNDCKAGPFSTLVEKIKGDNNKICLKEKAPALYAAGTMSVDNKPQPQTDKMQYSCAEKWTAVFHGAIGAGIIAIKAPEPEPAQPSGNVTTDHSGLVNQITERVWSEFHRKYIAPGAEWYKEAFPGAYNKGLIAVAAVSLALVVIFILAIVITVYNELIVRRLDDATQQIVSMRTEIGGLHGRVMGMPDAVAARANACSDFRGELSEIKSGLRYLDQRLSEVLSKPKAAIVTPESPLRSNTQEFAPGGDGRSLDRAAANDILPMLLHDYAEVVAAGPRNGPVVDGFLRKFRAGPIVKTGDRLAWKADGFTGEALFIAIKSVTPGRMFLFPAGEAWNERSHLTKNSQLAYSNFGSIFEIVEGCRSNGVPNPAIVDDSLQLIEKGRLELTCR